MAAYGPPGAPAGGCCDTTPPCGSMCVGAVSACGTTPPIDGATMTLSLGGSTVGTGTTTGQVSSVNMTAFGSGYTSPPTVTIGAPPAGGTTATGTVNLGTTNIASVALTAGGAGYTSPPTATIGGSIHGSGTTLVAKLGPTSVGSLTLTSGGTGYTNGVGYALSFNNTGSAGSGAAGTFDVVAGVVGNLVITNGGTGYTSLPSITFPGAGGSGAAGTVGLTPGAVTTLTRNLGGSNYLYGDTPTVVFSGGGGGTGATATATLGTFPVQSVTMTDNGAGYVAVPSVTFSGGGGTGAAGTATLRHRICLPIYATGLYTIAAAATGYTSGSTTFNVTDCTNVNSGATINVTLVPTLVPVCIRYLGCGSSRIRDGAIAVTLTQGGVTVASGNTGVGVTLTDTNYFCANIPPNVSTIATFTHPRFDLDSFTFTANSCGNNITLPNTGAHPKSGYACFTSSFAGSACANPTTTTLNASGGPGGALALALDIDGFWKGSLTYVEGGVTKTATYKLAGTCCIDLITPASGLIVNATYASTIAQTCPDDGATLMQFDLLLSGIHYTITIVE